MHAAIDAASLVVKRENLAADDIKEIRVGVDAFGCALFGAPLEVPTQSGAQFNAAYCVSSMIFDGKLDLDSFSAEAIKRTDVIEFMKRIKTVVDPDIEDEVASTYPVMPTPASVTIEKKSGETYKERLQYSKGNINNPMSTEELIDKFYHCAAHAEKLIPKTNLDKVVSLVIEGLEDIKDVRVIPSLLIA
jgi:2-methylcitrate dehydratase PrpD